MIAWARQVGFRSDSSRSCHEKNLRRRLNRGCFLACNYQVTNISLAGVGCTVVAAKKGLPVVARLLSLVIRPSTGGTGWALVAGWHFFQCGLRTTNDESRLRASS